MFDGAELRRLRLAAGLTQIELARRAGVGRHAVQYWEGKPIVRTREYAPLQFCKVLGLQGLCNLNARARGWGITPQPTWQEIADVAVENYLARKRQAEAERLSRRRVLCGAKTRKGGHCQNKSEAGKRRCKFHGGKSTGAKTPEGRARIAEAQRARWAAWRLKRAP